MEESSMNSKATDTILAQLDSLIQQSNTSIQSLQSTHQFYAQSLAAIDRIAGSGSKYADQAHNAILHPQARSRPQYSHDAIVGIIKGLRDDVANGYLTTLQERIHADMFSDYLGMAEYLLTDGYKDP